MLQLILPAIFFTAVSLLFYQLLSFNVSWLRYKYNIKAPKTVGHENFERAYRTHLNLAENLIIFIPVIWVSSMVLGQAATLFYGSVWIIGKILYSLSYLKVLKVPYINYAGNGLVYVLNIIYLIWILLKGLGL